MSVRAQQYAYVTSAGKNMVVIDTRTNTEVTSFPFSEVRRILAVALGGAYIYVTLQSNNQVAVLRTPPNSASSNTLK